jgi:hypothetical protein
MISTVLADVKTRQQKASNIGFMCGGAFFKRNSILLKTISH